MSEFVLKWYLRLFDALSMQSKLDLLTQLTERLRDHHSITYQEKEEKERLTNLKQLIFSWNKIDIEEDMITKSRTVSDKVYDL